MEWTRDPEAQSPRTLLGVGGAAQPLKRERGLGRGGEFGALRGLGSGGLGFSMIRAKYPPPTQPHRYTHEQLQ